MYLNSDEVLIVNVKGYFMMYVAEDSHPRANFESHFIKKM